MTHAMTWLASAVAAVALAGGAALADKPFEGQTLTVLNWNGYGSDTELAIQGFEERTGATVRHVYHSGGEELRQILRSGGIGEIDVALPNPTYILQMVGDDMLQPVDRSQLSNLDKIAPDFLDVTDLYDGDDLYGVPWVWGSTGLTYSTEAFPEPPTSWSVLWDEANAGKVAFMDSPIEAVMLAALHLGEDPHDPDLDAIRATLEEMRDNVQIYWSSSDDFNRAMITGSATVGNYWAGNAGSLMAEGHPVGYTIPEEGAVGWLSTWVIVKDAPNPELAHAWIDWMTSTEFQLAWAEDPDAGSPAPANMEASEQLSDEARARVQAFPEHAEKLAIMQSLTPEQQQVYADLLAEVKSGL